MGKRELSEAEAARTLMLLRRRLDRVHRGNIEAFARELGLVQSTLWRTMHERNAPTRSTAEALARVEGVSVESVLLGGKARAAEIAREAGISEEAVAYVLAEPEGEELRKVLWYLDRMRAIEAFGGPPPPLPASTAASATAPTHRQTKHAAR